MPYCDDRKIVFIHIPKTGGSSIEHYFGLNHRNKFMSGHNAYNEDGISFALQHVRARDFKILRPEEFESYFKFSFVRNPYDRVISEYFYNQGRKKFMLDEFRTWFKNFYLVPKQDHALSQFDYLYNEEGDLLVDFVGKLENLKADVSKICHLSGNLDLLPKNLPHERVKNNRPPGMVAEHILQREDKDMINELFENDFKYFNYSME